jgi:questin oxidase-like protein
VTPVQSNDPIPSTQALAAGTPAPTGAPRAPGFGTSPADALDAALERLQAGYPNTDVHRSNHVPMVVEALAVLGRAEAIGPWIDANLEHYGPDTEAGRRVDAENWERFLGQAEYFPDWRELFLAKLGDDDWPGVIRRWVPRLVPGLAGAATHGVIRTGHAVRSLTARDNRVRRAELATALAYWAVNFVELPWDGSLSPEKSVADALAKVRPRLPALEPPPGDIDTGLSALADTPSFLPVAGLVDVADPLRTLGEMSSSFARLYLRNPGRRIAFAHTITAPSALRLLAPHLDEETVLAATRRAWQAAAGIYVVYGDPRMRLPAEPARPSREALVDACVANGDAHSIKLTEACLREEAWTHDPILFTVAHDAGESMHG